LDNRVPEALSQNEKKTLAVILSHLPIDKLHNVQNALKDVLFEHQLYSRGLFAYGKTFAEVQHKVQSERNYLMDAVNESSISAHEKAKFREVLYAQVSGVKRTRTGLLYGGKRSPKILGVETQTSSRR